MSSILDIGMCEVGMMKAKLLLSVLSMCGLVSFLFSQVTQTELTDKLKVLREFYPLGLPSPPSNSSFKRVSCRLISLNYFETPPWSFLV